MATASSYTQHALQEPNVRRNPVSTKLDQSKKYPTRQEGMPLEKPWNAFFLGPEQRKQKATGRVEYVSKQGRETYSDEIEEMMQFPVEKTTLYESFLECTEGRTTMQRHQVGNFCF